MKEMKNKRGKTVFSGVGIALLLCLLMVMMPFAATVSNGDTTEEVSTEANSNKDNREESSIQRYAESTFEAEDYGYDADYEMLGMRDLNSKVFVAEDGGLEMIYSSEPLHYLDSNDDWQEIDYTIDSTLEGYQVTETDSPVYFESTAEDGYKTIFGGELEITSGVDSMLVTVNSEFSSEELEKLVEIDIPNSIDERKLTGNTNHFEISPIHLQTSENVLTGGNKVSYPLSDSIDLTYTVAQNEIKQEVVVNALPEILLEDPNFRFSDYFGLYERFEIPAGHKLVSADGNVLTGNELFQTDDYISIVESSTGEIVAVIEAPLSFDSSSSEGSMGVLESTYFLSVDASGTTGSIITAIKTSSLLSDDTILPVHIDPTFTYLATGQNNYYSCNVIQNSCHTDTDGEYRYTNWGKMYNTPRFPFQFTNTQPNGDPLTPVEKITSKVYYSSPSGQSSTTEGYADIIVLEDCGVSSTGGPQGANQFLMPFENPAGCTGNALQAYTPPVGTGDPEYTYQQPDNRLRMYWAGTPYYRLHHSTMGVDDAHNYGFGHYVSADDGSTGFNGIFPAGTYDYEMTDSWGDGLNGNAQYHIRQDSNTANNALNSVWGWNSGTITLPSGNWGSSETGTFTANHDFVVRYQCPQYSSDFWRCYTSENTIILQKQSGTNLPELTSGGNSFSTPPDATIQLGGGEEAIMNWECGSYCSENIIYWREAGNSWTTANSWQPDTSNWGAQYGTQFNSKDDGIIIQNPSSATMDIEFKVYDTWGDGTNGGSGNVEIASLGTWSPTVPGTPWGNRLVSSVSTESLGLLSVPSTSSGSQTVTLCSSLAECSDSSSTISILSDAIANGGYLEMGLGFGNSRVSQSPDATVGANSIPGDGWWDVDKFELIIDFQEITDDTTPPEDKTPVHYQGDSYATGPRTLLLQIEDSEHPIDTTTANGPDLWFSINGAPSIKADSELMSPVCNSKEQICTFSAQTTHLSVGDIVSYYWTYKDASAATLLKPNQAQNTGSSATVQFTIVDYEDAGSALKLTTLIEDVSASRNPSPKVAAPSTIDRQMTYFTDTNEYLFEFDTSDCESEINQIYSCFSTDSDDKFGHWDLLWQDSVNDCAPGASGCTGTSDNSLELDSVYGGLYEITRQFGAGTNLAFKYDSTAEAWAVAGVSDGSNGLRIQDKLDISAPDTILQSNDAAAGLAQFSFAPTSSPTHVINAGEYVIYSTDSFGDGPNGGELQDGSGNVLIGAYGGSGGNSGSSRTTLSVSDFSGPTMTLNYVCGSWCGETTIFVIPAVPDSQTSYSESPSYWDSWAFTIDLDNLPSEATEDGAFTGSFGEINLDADSGAANIICVTTNGLVYFMETSSEVCTASVAASSNGGTWQGFALGATVQGEQLGQEGMHWSIRNIAPDPDLTAPQIVHVPMGDSHSLNRKVSAIISDPGYQPSGLEVAAVEGVGPTLHYEVYKTNSGPTGTFTPLLMSVDGDKTLCVAEECTWSADIPKLSTDRDESVVYYITAQDTSTAQPSTSNPNGGINTVSTLDPNNLDEWTFDVKTPTNTLVVEWQNYASDFAANEKCTFQTIMYDVTNEIEFQYDTSCSSDEIVGVIGHRFDQSVATTIDNLNEQNAATGNPHSHNIRITVSNSNSQSVDYSYEYFDLGISTYLPMGSSDPAILPSSSNAFRTESCHAQFWATESVFCAGNFDIPDGFSFDFYGTTFNGDNGFQDRIHVSAAGTMHLLQNQPQSVGNDVFYDASTGITTDNGRVETQDSTWAGTPMDDMDSASSFYKDYSIAPWWSPASNDRCSIGNGCGGVWYRTIPFSGQGLPVSNDIIEDTTWYLVDSPIRVNPTSPTGYLAVSANLTIQPGVEVIVAENRGISFDSGDVNGACTQFNIGDASSTERVTFNASQENAVNGPATWLGLAFTKDCSDTSDRHTFVNVDILNTEHAAITAGNRPAKQLDNSPQDPQYKCGDIQNDCNVGEFVMSGMTFTNVDSAFAHGSGQGTVLTMSNFDINGARSACFNFAQNTIATLSGTPSDKSTMVDCNSDDKTWGGAVVSDTGSTAGSLTMSNIEITDSTRTVVRVDFKSVVISNVIATHTANQDPIYNQGNWELVNAGVSLGLSHGAGASVDISDFSAPNYHHGWIYAAGSVSMQNVDLGSGWANNHWFDIKPFGSSGTVAGATGSDAVFDGLTVPNLYMHRTFPGTLNDIVVAGTFSLSGQGTFVQDVILTGDSVIGDQLELSGCGANVQVIDATIGSLSSNCISGNKNVVDLTNTEIIHVDPSSSAIYLARTRSVMQEVHVISSVSLAGHYYAYVDQGSDLYLVSSNYTDSGANAASVDCADGQGATDLCPINLISGQSGTIYSSEVYYGGYANALAYRLGVVNSVTQSQILQSDVTITTKTLDSLGSVVAEIGSAITDSSGKTSEVVVLTGNHGTTPREVYTEHIVRATGSAGIGSVSPGDNVMFSNEVRLGACIGADTDGDGVDDTTQPTHPDDCADPAGDGEELSSTDGVDTPGTWTNPTFGDYTMGSYVDIRLIAPPVTFDDLNMDCNWMKNVNSTFMNAWDSVQQRFIFKGQALTIAGDMLFDGCSIELEGSTMLFKSGSLTLTDDATGLMPSTLLMTVDGDTGDPASITGENGAKMVNISVGMGGTLNIQAGTIDSLLVSPTFKDGLLVIESGGLLMMSGTSKIEASELTGLVDYPIVLANGGNVQVTTGSISGIKNTGVGLEVIGGYVDATSLTVTNTYVGVNGEDSALTLDQYTSESNTFGVQAYGSKNLPKIYRSSYLQGLDYNSHDSCLVSMYNACGQWVSYSVDLSTYIGQQDYLQAGMELEFGGHFYDPYTLNDLPYMTIDNMKVTMSDNSGQSWTIDSSDDQGYYPYSSSDPASGTTAELYNGGDGGIPSWNCNYQGLSASPYHPLGSLGLFPFGGPGSMSNHFSVSSYTYTSLPQFGFKWSGTNSPNDAADPYPIFNWGMEHSYWQAPFINPSTAITNYPTTFYQLPRGQTVDVCGAQAQPSPYINSPTNIGSSGMLSFPVVNISDADLSTVKVEFDVWHNLNGPAAGWMDAFADDNAQVLARGSSLPGDMPDWSPTLPNNGISITNSDINDAYVGVYLKGGDMVASFTDTMINDPSGFGVYTQGSNDVSFDGLDVKDTGQGLLNYGFYSSLQSLGEISVKNSDFSGLHTSIYFDNDVGTTVESTNLSNGVYGLRIGNNSQANYQLKY